LNKEKLKYLHNYLYLKYRNQVIIEFEDNKPDDFYSYIISRKVVIPSCTKSHQTEWTLFAFLHEIGHVLTNKPNQKRYLQEYLATQWAIEEAKNIGFDVPNNFIKIYQDYIWKWREKSIKLNGKNIHSKEEVKLIV